MPGRLIRDVEDANPNLIPVMNLFTALIPFLLTSAAFYRLSMIQISVPAASSTGETDIAKEDDKITLNLRITADKYELSASSDTLEPEKLSALRATVPRPPSQASAEEITAAHAKLAQAAHSIKGGYTASDTVIVVPDGEIPYEHVVDAMDAVRVVAVEVDGQRSRVSLFPRVVLSTLVRE